MNNILIIDDDKDSGSSLLKALSTVLSVNIHLAYNDESALEKLATNDFSLAILDLCLDEKIGVDSGFNLLKKIISNNSKIKVIVLTGHGSNENGVRALNLGASNFLEKPAEINHLSAIVKDCLQQVKILKEYSSFIDTSKESLEKKIVGNSDLIKKLRDEILYASSNKQALLIIGETGTGKGLCAVTIHNLGSLKGPFVRYQPNLLKNEMGASELFGHTKGAFTGADQNRKGLISTANKGTLFLDEIDELSLETQVALLGFLQDSKFRQIGSEEDLLADCRIISATNYPLEKIVEDNKLRSDFYFRITRQKIEVPPLRKRLEDLPLLINSFLEKLNLDNALNVFELDKKAISKLNSYNFPGNVRELEGLIENAVFRASYNKRNYIIEDDLGLTDNESFKKITLKEKVLAFKKEVVLKALKENNDNQVHAARDLEIDRSTLRRILEA